jgi:hypothetical protein
MKTIVFFAVFVVSMLASLGQVSLYKINRISFLDKDSILIENPFEAAFINPMFGQIDLDMDGWKDLYVFDREKGRNLTFINKKIVGKSTYRYDSKYEKFFPNDLYGFVALRDYNCDGLEDLFTATSGGMKVYKGTRYIDSSIVYTKVTNLLMTENMPKYGGPPFNIWVSGDDMPVIEDIDGDGDLDILAVSLGDVSQTFYINLQKEKGWSCDSLRYQIKAGCWGKSVAYSNPFRLYPNACGGDTADEFAHPKPPIKSRHNGATSWALDEDGDGDWELVSGDVGYSYAIHGKNLGTRTFAKLDSFTTIYPDSAHPISYNFPVGYWMDIDNDGKKDMVVNGHSDRIQEVKKSVTNYKNISTNSVCDFKYQSDNFMLKDIIDVGAGARPFFFNYNEDSLMDLVVSNDYNYDSEKVAFSSLYLYRNIGTRLKPIFKFETSDFGGLGQYRYTHLHPTFGDFNDDGHADMITGTAQHGLIKSLNVFVNGVSTYPIHELNTIPVNNLKFATPFLYDFNKDATLDIVTGEIDGNLFYIKNTGTKSSPNFNTNLIHYSFGNVKVEDSAQQVFFNLYSAPSVSAVDSTHEPYLLVTNSVGNVAQYKIIKDSLDWGSFPRISKNIFPLKYKERSYISMADINGDSALDVMVGYHTGGLMMYSFKSFDSLSKKVDTVIVTKDIRNTTIDFDLYPNPTKDIIYIKSNNWITKSAVIFDHLGREIMKFTFQNESKEIDLRDLSNGIYHIVVREGEERVCRKIVRESITNIK